MNEHRVTCSRCIMDVSDPDIMFDEHGHCNHCRRFFETIDGILWLPNEQGSRILGEIVQKVKDGGIGKQYDGIIGLSGGVDSSYLLCKLVEWGIRPLAVHVDAGWNSELAVKNIEVLCKKLKVDLHTIVIDWESMRKVQNAFLRSGVKNQDIPQDHAFFAGLYGYAVKNDIKYVFSGSNFATESILPVAWGHDSMDASYISAILDRYGDGNIKNFPIIGFWKYYFYYPYIKRMKILKPLNFMDYRKNKAISELEIEYGWRYYGAKHWESRFTKFFQGYYLPTRFGYDKRKAHLSSLIVSGEITRDEALAEMKKPIYPLDQLDSDKFFVLKKLHVTPEEFEQILRSPVNLDKIPTNETLLMWSLRVKKALKYILR